MFLLDTLQWYVVVSVNKLLNHIYTTKLTITFRNFSNAAKTCLHGFT